MKGLFAVVVSAGVAFACLAESGVKLSPEEKRLRSEQIKKAGRCTVPGTPAGKILIQNAQKEVAASNFDVTGMTDFFAYKPVMNRVEGEPATVATALKMRNDAKADFAVFIVDNGELPASLVAYEEKWAIVNVGKLRPGAATPEMVRIRARNEFLRVFALLCGSATSQYPFPLMCQTKEPADLDKCLPEYPGDVAMRITSYLNLVGVKPEQKVSYQRACQLGWAPAPTNEYQKAIWDRVHAIPKNPMKIEFDPKKGR